MGDRCVAATSLRCCGGTPGDQDGRGTNELSKIESILGDSDVPKSFTRSKTRLWKRTGYGGPCPPVGRHRYFFKLYALDSVLPDLGEPTKAELLQAIEGHVLGEAVLMGTYAH